MSKSSIPLPAITLALLCLVLAWDASGWDLAFARLAGGAHGFPWRQHWLLTTVLHQGGRALSWALAFWVCLSVRSPSGPLARLDTSHRLQLALSCLLSALAVSVLKTVSATSCPWDLSVFGGTARWVSHWHWHWHWGAGDGGTGGCFPAGHASSGFAFVGGFFALRRQAPRAARAWLAVAVMAGFVLGLAQQWRGAHFMSHTLWTAWLCWALAGAVDAAWQRWASQRPDAADEAVA
ncbi:phosphatase PAP2 family protein [Schlegelella sp. S2-27]|uniref:Phosphatase PAP2 family protein n=1 Tax=Caldimonas mangrovi TaxID=2944811 RepID=A0ABT0YR50_9BURK|nr:phosphatase PAP2 family protein [Caldimonas mangrovi]MCM5681205.1 phosphatase PAP2 family protein [Caldimonas mangrovi]